MDDHRDIGVSPPTEETLWTDTFYLLHSIKSRGRSPYITTIYGNDNLGGIERKVFTPDEENGLVVRSVLFYAPDFCLSEDRAWWAYYDLCQENPRVFALYLSRVTVTHNLKTHVNRAWFPDIESMTFERKTLTQEGILALHKKYRPQDFPIKRGGKDIKQAGHQ